MEKLTGDQLENFNHHMMAEYVNWANLLNGKGIQNIMTYPEWLDWLADISEKKEVGINTSITGREMGQQIND